MMLRITPRIAKNDILWTKIHLLQLSMRVIDILTTFHAVESRRPNHCLKLSLKVIMLQCFNTIISAQLYCILLSLGSLVIIVVIGLLLVT